MYFRFIVTTIVLRIVLVGSAAAIPSALLLSIATAGRQRSYAGRQCTIASG